MLIKYPTLTVIWAVILAVILLIPGSNVPRQEFMVDFDKVVHIGIYGVFSFLFINSIKSVNTRLIRNNAILFSFFATFTYSIILELLQTFVPLRDFDFIDIWANGIGIICGLFLFSIIYKI